MFRVSYPEVTLTYRYFDVSVSYFDVLSYLSLLPKPRSIFDVSSLLLRADSYIEVFCRSIFRNRG